MKIFFSRIFFFLIFISGPFNLFSQKGKDGNVTISTINTVVNSYSSITAPLNAGDLALNVSNTLGLVQGDLVMIIQMQGAVIKGNIENNTWGEILDYKNCGNYEFKEVKSVGPGNIINLSCKLEKNYDYQVTVTGGGNTATAYAGTQIIKVKRYDVLTVTATGSITANPWNGKTGGVVAVEANSIIIDGKIDVSNKGFRGGIDKNLSDNQTSKLPKFGTSLANEGASKGESIAGGGSYNAPATIHVTTCTFLGNKCLGVNGPGGSADMTMTDLYKYVAWYKSKSPAPTRNQIIAWACPPATNLLPGMDAICTEFVDSIIKYASISPTAIDYTYFVYGEYGRGAPANGGGGGTQHNGGGGGGSNAGTGTWTGIGIPNSVYNTAWALDPEIIGISAGGGRGGYTWGGVMTNLDPFLTPPNNAAWQANYRRIGGGLGGRPLDYSTGKIFMGGGGGHGDNNDACGSTPGNGGGLIYLLSYGNISGSGSISANGGDGGNQPIAPICPNGNDGVSGGGGGGTVIANSSGTVSVAITANGGKGSTQQIANRQKSDHLYECEGPGGGGGGGYIAVSSGIPTRTVNGGANGITDQLGLVGQKFPPNGATSGAQGITAVVSPISINSNCDFNIDAVATPNSICKGGNTSLSVTVIGGTPMYSYVWDHGLPATAGPHNVTLNATDVYHVTVTENGGKSAVDSVTVTVETPSLTAFTAVCSSDASFTLTGGSPTGGTYKVDGVAFSTFDPKTAGAGTHNITYISPAGCSATQNIDVKSAPAAHIDGATTVCPGSTTTLTASGGGTYLWSENNATTAQITVSPVGTPTYSVTVNTNGCTASATHAVNVSGALTPTILTTDSKTSVCAGDSLQLTATGGATYQWASGEQTDVINTHALQNPKTYTVSVYGSDVACSGTALVTILVNPLPVAVITGTGVCSGKDAVLTASGADAGGHYRWDDGTTVTPKTVKPLINTTYYVTAYNASGCSDSTHYIVIVSSNPVPVMTSKKQRICSGTSTVLKASGGTTYSWSNLIVIDSIVVNPATNTQFTVTVTNAANCTATDTLTIQVIPPPDNPLVDDADRCSNDPVVDVTLTIPNPKTGYVYRWYSSATAGTLLKQGPNYTEPQVNAAHTYYIETISPDSCHSNNRQQVNINWNQPPTASFYYEPAGVVIQGAPIHMINQSVNAVKYVWSFGRDEGNSEQKEPYKIYSDSGLFMIVLTAISGGNCKVKDSMEIYVKKRLLIWLPDIFTPNNDGKNDLFYVRGPVKTMKLEVYNQWGFLVFKSEKQTDGWDGKYKGVEQPEGNYVWILDAVTTDEQKTTQRGVILLSR